MSAERASRAHGQLTFPHRSLEVRDLVDALTSERYSGAVVLGGPGLGKSTLAQTAVKEAGHQGPILQIQCSRHLSEVPYGALTPHVMDLDELTNPVQVLRSLQKKAKGAIFVIMDVQYLDAASAFVLAQLVQNRVARLIAMGAGSQGRSSGIAALADTGMLRTIHLAPAGLGRVRRQCELILGGPVTAGTVRTIHGLSGGNPRLVGAIIESALDQDVLVRADEPAISGQPAPWILSRGSPDPDSRLVDHVETLVDTLVPDERECLEIVALAGPSHRSVLRAVVGDVVQNLVDSGLVREVAPDVVDLSAGLLSEILRERIPPGHSVELFQRWSSVARDNDRTRSARSVLWAVESGQELDMEEIFNAGYLALQAKDWGTARALIPVIREIDNPQATMLVAELMLVSGRSKTARSELMTLAAHARHVDQFWETASMIALHDARNGVAPNAWTALPAVIDAIPDYERHLHRSPRAVLDLLDLLRGGIASEHRLNVQVLAETVIRDSTVVEVTRAILMLMRAELLTMSGDPGQAIPAAQEAYQLAGSVPEYSARFGLDAVVYLVMANLTAGHLDDARRVLKEQFALGPYRWYPRSGTLLFLDYLIDAIDGIRPGDQRQLEDAVVELRQQDPAKLLVFADSTLAPYRAAQTVGHQGPTAEERAAEEPYGPVPRWLFSLALYDIAEGHRMIEPGREPPLWQRILDDDRLQHDKVVHREILGTLCLLQEPLDADPELMARFHAAAAATGGPRAQALQRALDPALSDDPRGLALAADALTASGQLLAAGIAWARLTLLHHHAGDLRRRGEARRRLKALQTRTGVLFPPFVSGTLALGELSPREQEIVELAAQGMSNAEIAEKLVVSQRTVEGHLYRVFSKLGIAERAELRDLDL